MIGAALFLVLVGALGTWLLRAKFPRARFMTVGYALMSLGGLAFLVWTLTRALPAGILGLVVFLSAGIVSMIGVLRKEVRVVPPG